MRPGRTSKPKDVERYPNGHPNPYRNLLGLGRFCARIGKNYWLVLSTMNQSNMMSFEVARGISTVKLSESIFSVTARE